MSDWSSRNGYKPRNDLIVLERDGDLVVRKRRRRPKPQRAVMGSPHTDRCLPPPKPQSSSPTTRSTNVKNPPPEFFQQPSLLELIAVRPVVER